MFLKVTIHLIMIKTWECNVIAVFKGDKMHEKIELKAAGNCHLPELLLQQQFDNGWYSSLMSYSATEQHIKVYIFYPTSKFMKNVKQFMFIITVKELTYHGFLSKYLKAIQSRVFPWDMLEKLYWKWKKESLVHTTDTRGELVCAHAHTGTMRNIRLH